MKIKDWNVMIHRTGFDHSFKSDMRTYDNIRKLETGQGDNYTAGCLLDIIILISTLKWWQ